MKKGLIITVIIIAIVAAILIAVYFTFSRKSKELDVALGAQEVEKAQAVIQQKKLDNAPEARQDILKLIEVLKHDRTPWTNMLGMWTTRAGTKELCRTTVPPISVGRKSGQQWCYTKSHIQQVISWYNEKIKVLEQEYQSLL